MFFGHEISGRFLGDRVGNVLTWTWILVLMTSKGVTTREVIRDPMEADMILWYGFTCVSDMGIFWKDLERVGKIVWCQLVTSCQLFEGYLVCVSQRLRTRSYCERHEQVERERMVRKIKVKKKRGQSRDLPFLVLCSLYSFHNTRCEWKNFCQSEYTL